MDKIVSVFQMLLSSKAGSFGFVLALMLLAFWLVHWVTKKVTEIKTASDYIKNDNEKTSEKLEKITESTSEKLEKLTESTSEKLEKHAERVDKNMDEIRRDISYLKAMLDIYNRTIPADALAQAHSPVSLTPLGIQVANELGADDMIARNWDKIFQTLENEVCNKNAYDIQAYCLETATVELEKFLDNDSIEKIKLVAYKAGKALAYYAPVFGIKIRDKYLQIKGISVDEVDKNDPSRNH